MKDSIDQRFGEFVEATTLVELLRSRAIHEGTRLAYTYLIDGENDEVSLSYGDLDRESRRIGAWLRRRRMGKERALLLFPPGLDYLSAFFGCLYAGTIAVPAYPPQSGRSQRGRARLEAMIRDADVALILTTSSTKSKASEFGLQRPGKSELEWISLEEIPAELAEDWIDPQVKPEDVVFLQYTSGSTSQPKGVIVTHQNLLANEAQIAKVCRHTAESTFVGWLPLYHDMGLVGNVMQPLYLGAQCVLMSPGAFLQKPIRWLSAISRRRARTSGAPNFAYDLCVQKTKLEEREGLDLSSWETAFNGAEPVHAETMERFVEVFGKYGFRREAFFPCYGMAEASLIITGGKRVSPIVKRVSGGTSEHCLVKEVEGDDPGGRNLVGCGAAVPGVQLLIVNPDTRTPCKDYEVGEIWASGPNIAKGYWNQPEKSAQIFRARLASEPSGEYLKTSDLGFLDRGELFVAGRLQDLIIIRGQNHHPEDIEWTIQERLEIPTRCAAFSIEKDNTERLMILLEIPRRSSLSPDRLAQSIRKVVSENHELQVHTIGLVNVGGIPTTTSGKIQRSRCRAEFVAGRLPLVSVSSLGETLSETSEQSYTREDFLNVAGEERRRLMESYLSDRIRRMLGEVDFHPASPLTAIGLDSLLAMELKARVQSEIGLDLSISQLLGGAAVDQLAARLIQQLNAPQTTQTPAASIHQSDVTPLSYGQRALWFLNRLTPQRAAYTIARAIRIRGPLDKNKLRLAFAAVLERHTALRIKMFVERGEPKQRFDPHIDPINLMNASDWTEAEMTEFLNQEANRPFDLENDALVRILLLLRSSEEHLLLLTAHHAVCDLWSFGIILQDLDRFYTANNTSGSATVDAAPSYADFIQWQAEMICSEQGALLEKYWRGKLAGKISSLELPTDGMRSATQRFNGAEYRFRIDAGLTQRLRTLARSQQATLYMVLLTGLQTLLYRYTNQNEILVGSSTAGRSRPEFANLVGYCTNSVVIRADFYAEETFDKLLSQIKQSVSEALEHQDYPLALLTEKLQPTRDASRSPLFQVMFTLQGTPSGHPPRLSLFALGDPDAQMEMGDLHLELIPLEQKAAQFDLSLLAAETAGEIVVQIKFDVDLFRGDRIERLATHYLALLDCVAKSPQTRLSEIPLNSEEEQRRLLYEWSRGEPALIPNERIHEAFEEQVRRTPDATAVGYGEEYVSFAQLNAQADRIAQSLQHAGARPGAIVGVCMERSIELISAILGTLKTGAAYLPLDPNSPQQYLETVLEESKAPVIITQRRLASGALNRLRTPVLEIESFQQPADSRSVQNPSRGSSPDDLAYVIFTSGTTGAPKGVMVRHRSVLSLRAALNKVVYDQNPQTFQRIGLNAPIWFDASVKQLIALLDGRRLEVIPEKTRESPSALLDYLDKRRLDAIDCTPSHFKVWMAAGFSTEDLPMTLLIGGEAIDPSLWKTLAQSSALRAFNVYGPTECTVDAAACELRTATKPTLGRPIPNAEIYLLDLSGRPVPSGVFGELYIGGEGVASGYLGRPDLSAAKFLPHPWSGQPGRRLYQSGDFARYTQDGAIEFLGRQDRQLKIRGNRLEPGMIEEVLRSHPGVDDALAIAVPDGAGEKELAIYVIRRNPLLSRQEVTMCLEEKLPAYYMPHGVAFLEAFPLNANRKLDLRALPPIVKDEFEISDDFVEPFSELERLIASMVSKALGVHQVGLHENFFELGGHSLLATHLVSQLQEFFPTQSPLLTAFFENPTVSGLATGIMEESLNPAQIEESVQTLQRIFEMGDEEIEGLLVKDDAELSLLFGGQSPSAEK